jgi:hypothetical protein
MKMSSAKQYNATNDPVMKASILDSFNLCETNITRLRQQLQVQPTPSEPNVFDADTSQMSSSMDENDAIPFSHPNIQAAMYPDDGLSSDVWLE